MNEGHEEAAIVSIDRTVLHMTHGAITVIAVDTLLPHRPFAKPSVCSTQMSTDLAHAGGAAAKFNFAPVSDRVVSRPMPNAFAVRCPGLMFCCAAARRVSSCTERSVPALDSRTDRAQRAAGVRCPRFNHP
eukprot:1278506-Rhodomonas_salina.1